MHITKLIRDATVLAIVMTALLGSATAQPVAPMQPAPAYPSKPIRVIVPYAAGGTADVIARVLAEKASVQLGQTIIIDNRSGGDGIIGAQAAARSKPDGYTLLQVSTAHVILPTLRQDLGYDSKKDFVPVFGTTGVPQAIAVDAKSSVRSMTDLAAVAKSAPQGISYASGGNGSISHLTAAYIVGALKIQATHVPYRGLSNAVQAVMGNQVLFTVVNIPDVIELAKSGSLRLLAVTSEKRLPYLPDVPTLAEQGFDGWTSSSWSAYIAPANTPADVIDRIYRAYAAAANDAAVKERLGSSGVVITLMNGTELGRFMADDTNRWRRIIEENHIKLD